MPVLDRSRTGGERHSEAGTDDALGLRIALHPDSDVVLHEFFWPRIELHHPLAVTLMRHIEWRGNASVGDGALAVPAHPNAEGWEEADCLAATLL